MKADPVPPGQRTASGAGAGGHRQAILRGERDGLTRAIGFITAIAALVCGGISFVILTGLTPIVPTNNVIGAAVMVNGVLISVLAFLIVREVYRLIQSRRRGRAAARLHIRIIGLFALVAAVPAILVAIVAGITLDRGLDRWFEVRTRTIVDSSVEVAQAYVTESYRGLQGSTLSMARELDQARQLYSLDRTGFIDLMTLHARGRGILGARLIRIDGSIIVETNIPQDPPLPPPPADALNTVSEGLPVLIPPGGRTNLVGALIKLSNIPSAYLYTVRVVDPQVLNALRLMEENRVEYRGLEENRFTYQIAFAILYVGVCLIVLLSAMWMGISVADRFVSPIRRLITAADEVSAGNLEVAVSTHHAEGDLRSLSNTFNVMISELKSQRDEILEAKDDIDQRARFTEAVLSGVSAAVLSVDRDGRVTIANRSGLPLLGAEEQASVAGRPLAELAPELAEVFQAAVASGRGEYRQQITMLRSGMERTLNARIAVDDEATGGKSWVITVDDITDLVAAQRNTAWADVARRIAHEIKNPLTPIQLSAERIRRRFGKQIDDDRDVFEQCTDTIVRQVSDIGRMVDEFSSFARMPAPEMKSQDLSDAVSEAVFLQKVANPQIEFTTDLGDQPLPGMFDQRLISQALTNVIKNATEAIEAVSADQGGAKRHKGRIAVRACREGERLIVEVIDNGKGLPAADRQRLLEPYMTTREKGTGLGLAIVRKIMEDHGGGIELLDAPAGRGKAGGAIARLTLPVAADAEPAARTARKKPARRRKSAKKATAQPEKSTS